MMINPSPLMLLTFRLWKSVLPLRLVILSLPPPMSGANLSSFLAARGFMGVGF